MRFKSIQEIRDHKWVGNFHADSEAFKAVDAFASREFTHTLAERAEAWRIAAKVGMGLTEQDDPSLLLNDAAFVAECMAQME